MTGSNSHCHRHNLMNSRTTDNNHQEKKSDLSRFLNCSKDLANDDFPFILVTPNHSKNCHDTNHWQQSLRPCKTPDSEYSAAVAETAFEADQSTRNRNIQIKNSSRNFDTPSGISRALDEISVMKLTGKENTTIRRVKLRPRPYSSETLLRKNIVYRDKIPHRRRRASLNMRPSSSQSNTEVPSFPSRLYLPRL